MYPFDQKSPPIVLPQEWGAIALDVWRPWGASDREVAVPVINIDGCDVIWGFDRIVVVVPAGEHTIGDRSFIPKALRGQVTVVVEPGVVVAIEHIASVTFFPGAPGRFSPRGARPAHTLLGAMMLTLVTYAGAFLVALFSTWNVMLLLGLSLSDNLFPGSDSLFAFVMAVMPVVLFLRYWRWPRQPFRRRQRPDLPSVVTRDREGIERPARVVSLTDARVPDRL